MTLKYQEEIRVVLEYKFLEDLKGVFCKKTCGYKAYMLPEILFFGVNTFPENECEPKKSELAYGKFYLHSGANVLD
ncbi:hypothetical protein EGI26_10340 [Lacihabitans sp. CCS-44]|nr:hypothetical protein [Lacihabitans sp. CCS-44]